MSWQYAVNDLDIHLLEKPEVIREMLTEASSPMIAHRAFEAVKKEIDNKVYHFTERLVEELRVRPKVFLELNCHRAKRWFPELKVDSGTVIVEVRCSSSADGQRFICDYRDHISGSRITLYKVQAHDLAASMVDFKRYMNVETNKDGFRCARQKEKRIAGGLEHERIAAGYGKFA